MKEIKLTQDKITLVDDDNYDDLNKFKWQAFKLSRKDTYYAYRRPVIKGTKGKKHESISMARLIMGLKPYKVDKRAVDHINRDTLDNRKVNLRICNWSQNMANVPKRSNNKSGFKGVSWNKRDNRWRMTIKLGDKYINRNFKDITQAAKKYDELAKKYYKEYALTNF